MTNEILSAAERTFHAAGCKPKDTADILNKLQAEYGVTASESNGLLKLEQSGTVMDIGAALGTYRQKYPRDFYGEAGEVNFKSDLAGDSAAKARFISEKGLSAWEALPYDSKSPGANKVVTDAIPLASMTCAEYLRLSVAEKSKLAGNIGISGIQKIMARKGKK
jgi:hypothetical protein